MLFSLHQETDLVKLFRHTKLHSFIDCVLSISIPMVVYRASEEQGSARKRNKRNKLMKDVVPVITWWMTMLQVFSEQYTICHWNIPPSTCSILRIVTAALRRRLQNLSLESFSGSSLSVSLVLMSTGATLYKESLEPMSRARRTMVALCSGLMPDPTPMNKSTRPATRSNVPRYMRSLMRSSRRTTLGNSRRPTELSVLMLAPVLGRPPGERVLMGLSPLHISISFYNYSANRDILFTSAAENLKNGKELPAVRF
ncbi:uncharacterized protein LOC135392160 isoform X3 [Ornithodoros turicata]|uniref:uncharacterized protein LOC135392160 isoform X3 n=1 Tax=Ornithodoros turicata TaxID=34597 RepID=UPI0031387044